MTHPLDLPEILYQIGQYLWQGDLSSCSLVSHTWNATITPLLYRNIIIENDIPLEVHTKYADNIEILEVDPCTSTSLLSFSYPRLTNLSLKCQHIKEENSLEISQLIIDIIHKHKNTLKAFQLTSCKTPLAIAPWNTLAECPQLNMIGLFTVAIHPTDAMSFWKVCTRLSALFYSHVWYGYGSNRKPDLHYTLPVSSNGELNPELRFNHLKTLYVRNHSNSYRQLCDIMWLIRGMRNLERFDWTIARKDELTISLFSYALALNTLSKLQHFTLNYISLDDSQISALLNSIIQIKSLKLSRCGYSVDSHHALMSHHFSTLQELKLGICFTITSSMVQDILTKCPCLEVLEAFKIFGSDVARYQWEDYDEEKGEIIPEKQFISNDWVCLNLRTLVLLFDMSCDEMKIDQSTTEGRDRLNRQRKLEHEHVFRQLSRLERLETFDCRFNNKSEPQHNSLSEIDHLQFNLKSRGGELEKLSRMRNLVTLKTGNQHLLSEEELHWMEENLPRLRHFHVLVSNALFCQLRLKKFRFSVIM